MRPQTQKQKQKRAAEAVRFRVQVRILDQSEFDFPFGVFPDITIPGLLPIESQHLTIPFNQLPVGVTSKGFAVSFVAALPSGPGGFAVGSALPTFAISNLFLNYATIGSSISSIDLIQNGQTNPDPDNNGTIDLTPGQPVTVLIHLSAGDLPSGTGLLTVNFQAGSSPAQSASVDLSSGSGQAAFTFTPSDSGTFTLNTNVQTVTGESDSSDNARSIQVSVTGFKLAAFIGGVRAPDSGSIRILPPSVIACGSQVASADGLVPLQIQCIKTSDSSPASDCQFILELSPTPNLGGHHHGLADESRPLQLDPASPNFPTGALLPVDTRGAVLTYTPPEVSGDVFCSAGGPLESVS